MKKSRFGKKKHIYISKIFSSNLNNHIIRVECNDRYLANDMHISLYTHCILYLY